MNTATICIPFRDRGRDPARSANLKRVLEHWADFGFGCAVRVFDDGRSGDEQFCRSAAYNRAAREIDSAVLIYTESDMLLDHSQILEGITLAVKHTGLVVPFTQYRYLNPSDSDAVRGYKVNPVTCQPDLVLDNGESIGAVNILSRKSLSEVGQWDENFEGAWYDDRAMERAFEITCGPTRFVNGPAYHLYHLPGWEGRHLTDEDRDAVTRNELRYLQYLNADTPEQIRELTTAMPVPIKRSDKNVARQVNWDNPRNDPTRRKSVAEDPNGTINRKLRHGI